MTAGQGDRDATTRTLLEAALEELLTVGQAEFAMEGVARRGFYSIGTVYNRWPDRDSLLHDVGMDVLAPAITTSLGAAAAPEDAIAWALGEGQPTLLAAGEILLAGHTMPAVRPASLRVWTALREGLAAHLPESMTWYAATYAIGQALLGALGVLGPDPATGRIPWFADASVSAVEAETPQREWPTPESFDIPVVPGPERTDDVALALIGAAQMLLQQHGAAGTSTRGIAASAGVTTGALYRRYEGKSRLLADVLVTQLQPDRYTWTWDLVRALAGEDPYADAATVLADRMITVAGDAPAQKVLLQVGIAARSDAALREQVAERISVAHSARVEMVRQFAVTGILRADVSADVFAWGFQAVPVGVRAVLPLGIDLDSEEVRASMAALLRAAASTD